MLLQYKTESVKPWCLSPQNQSYSLHQSDSKGSLGSKSHRLDEVGTLTHTATEISAGGNLNIISTGNQTIEAAKLNAGGNLTITSTQGSISFNAVKDLLQETHEKSNSNLAWQSAKGHGSIDETIRQSQLAVTGQTLINAAQTVKIDIQQVDAQSVHDAITAMVNSDPRLAWLQTEEAKGNIDWHQVKAIHDSWQYKQSGLGPGAALAVAIVMSIYAGPAGAAMLGLDAAAVAGSAAAIEFAAGSAAIGGLATTSTLSLISNKGDLGAMFADITSSNAIKGYLTAAATAGFTEGIIKPNLSGSAVADSTASSNPAFNNITHGFNISKLDGMAGFTTYTATQALAGATINTAINGGSFADNLSNSIGNAATTIAGALLYNQVGNYAQANNLLDGDPQKVILHGLVGGLLTQANGGDFATGAVAAGVSEAVSKELATLVNNNPALQNMTAQLIGIATTALTNGDVNQAANVASMGDLYNRKLHSDQLASITKIANGDKQKEEQYKQVLCVLQNCNIDGLSGYDEAAKSTYAKGVELLQSNTELFKSLGADITAANLLQGQFDYTLGSVDFMKDAFGLKLQDTLYTPFNNLTTQPESWSDFIAGAIKGLASGVKEASPYPIDNEDQARGAIWATAVQVVAGTALGVKGSVAGAADISLTIKQLQNYAALESANKPYNASGLTQAARAWDKHDTTRPGGTYEPITGNTAIKNANAEKFALDTINNPNVSVQTLSGGAIQYRLPNGQGFRIETDGRFNLLDPKK